MKSRFDDRNLSSRVKRHLFKEAFRVFDVEGVGFIEAEEMRNILLQLPESLTDDEMEEMLRTGDRNRDGKFDLAEFG